MADGVRSVPILEVKDLTKRFGARRKPAVAGLDFKVWPGEFHAFIGANGAGKTTTIKCVIGAYVRHGGQVLIGGIPARRPEAKALVGYIPETTRFPPHFSARQYLLALAEISGLPRAAAKARVEGLLARFGMAPLGDANPDRFSSGQKKKIVLIQALLADPKLLIMDEPTANLDPRARIEFFDTLKELQREGASFFVSTHILSEVSDYADALTIVDGGKIALTGRVDEILASHAGRGLTYDVSARLPDRARAALAKLGLRARPSPFAPLCVSVRDEAQARAALRALAAAPAGLTAFTPRRPSLDEIYREYVRVGSVHTAADDPGFSGPRPAAEERK